MKKSTATALLSCLLLSFSPLSFADGHEHHDDEHRQHGAHEHGKVAIHLAQEGKALLVEVHAPGFDLMGFESQPKTEEQKAAYARAMQLLNQPAKLFTLSDAANCQLVEMEIDTALEEDDHDHDSAHSEFGAEYQFECQAIAKLHHIDFHWFESFPSTKSISLHALTDKGTKTMQLSPTSTKFYL